MDRSELFRLILAKRFVQDARNNAQKGDAESLAIAVANMHDAFDNLLGTLASHLGVHLPDDSTMLKTFSRIASAGHPLGSPTKLAQLNAIRNDVKHQGLHPNPLVVKQLVPELANLADELSERFLGRPLSGIQLVDAVVDPEIHADMALIQDVIETGDFMNALEQMAFVMFRVYEQPRFGIFRMARALWSIRSGEQQPDFEFPELDRTEKRLDFVELGLDPQEYDAFHRVVPRVGLRSGSDTAYILKKDRRTWHELILAKQDRPGRPPVTSISPVDLVTFVQDGALYEDKQTTKVLENYRKGDTVHALALPFVDGAWQNHGEDVVLANVFINSEWDAAYFRKADVEVTPDVRDPQSEPSSK